MPRRRTCGLKYFCLGAFLIFLGSILLCSLGFTVVLPHVATRHWTEVQCHVINSSFLTGKCSCTNQMRDDSELGCAVSYPCLQINVLYQLGGIPRTDDVTDHVAVTSDNVTEFGVLYKSWEDAYFETCTLHECGDEQWTVQATEAFRDLYGRPPASYPCYVDRTSREKVVLTRTPASLMVHAVLWPSLCLGLGLALWMGLWLGCWEVHIEKHSLPEIDRTRGINYYY